MTVAPIRPVALGRVMTLRLAPLRGNGGGTPHPRRGGERAADLLTNGTQSTMIGRMLTEELRQRLTAIGAFADELESPDFDPGQWHDSERRQTADDEVWTMPWFELSDRAEAFLAAIRANGWIEPFDWMDWAQTDEATALRDDRAALGRATLDQLQRLLTAVVRAERFSDGTLEWAFDSGLMAAIARRAQALAAEPDPAG